MNRIIRKTKIGLIPLILSVFLFAFSSCGFVNGMRQFNTNKSATHPNK